MLAMYMRLSLAEEGKGTADDPSGSIEAQELILSEYVASKPELTSMEVRKFVDDGRSGTNMDRPGLQEMLELCKKRQVKCVVVKDFSRLARNYLDAGDLAERIFPVLGIRFIAVSDGYDSEVMGVRPEDGFMMGLTNIINAGYSAELSHKLKASHRSSWARGDSVSGFAPFGYVSDRKARGRMAVDPVASKYVRRVFELAAELGSTTKAARQLEREGVPTPAVYMGENGLGTYTYKHAAWNSVRVLHIIKNEAYLGTLVAGTKKVTCVGSRKLVSADPNEVVRVEDAHDPIVSRELFDLAQKAIVRRAPAKRGAKKAKDGLFTNMVLCPECGRRARTVRKNYQPVAYKVDCDCGGGASVGVEDMEIAVRGALAVQAKLAGIRSIEAKAAAEGFDAEADGLARRLAEVDREVATLRIGRRSLYEDLVADVISDRRYASKKLKLSARIAELTAEGNELRARLDRLGKERAKKAKRSKACGKVASVDTAGKLNGVLVEELVERVDLASDGSIKVTFKFEDLLREEA